MARFRKPSWMRWIETKVTVSLKGLCELGGMTGENISLYNNSGMGGNHMYGKS
jgi:hypothetical protein